MKIIGKTNGNEYIVTISSDEIALAAGYAYANDFRRECRDALDYDGHFKTGTTINVKSFPFLAAVRAHEMEAQRAANTLRALADMLTSALPTTVIPPAPEEPAAQ